MVPPVRTFSAVVLDVGEASFPVLKHHAFTEPFERELIHIAVDPHRVLPVDFLRGVHQSVG